MLVTWLLLSEWLQWTTSTEGYFIEPHVQYVFLTCSTCTSSCSPCGRNHEHTMTCPNPKEGCSSNGKFYKEGYTWNDDKCKKCTCHNGKAECKNDCCYMNGTEYQHGNTWLHNKCQNCTCCHGNINCKDICCKVNGYLYEDNKKFLLRHCHGCHNHSEVECICRKGDVQCIDNCFGTCYAYGSPHYITFDGKYFDFQGNCRYIHAMDCENSVFRVEVQNTEFTKNRRVTLVKEAFIYLIYKEYDLCGYSEKSMEEQIEFLHSGVQINGVQVNLPIHVNTSLLKYSITQLFYGVYLQSSSHNIRVFWSASRNWIRVYVGYSHFGRLCGLCANFDENATNDISINNVPAAVSHFGNHWKSKISQQPSCVSVAEAVQRRNRGTAKSRPQILPGIPFPCNQRSDGASLFKEALLKCAHLRNPPSCCNCGYEPLRKEEVFVRACIYDYCSCDDREECMRNANDNYFSLGKEDITVAIRRTNTEISTKATSGPFKGNPGTSSSRIRTAIHTEGPRGTLQFRERVPIV